MPDSIKIAPGNDNVDDLLAFLWSPDFDGIQYPRTVDTSSGLTYQDGKPFVILRFPDIMTPADWVDTIGRCGLSTTKSGEVTLHIPGENKKTYVNYNGIAVRPEYGRDLSFRYVHYQRPSIIVRRLELITS